MATKRNKPEVIAADELTGAQRNFDRTLGFGYLPEMNYIPYLGTLVLVAAIGNLHCIYH